MVRVLLAVLVSGAAMAQEGGAALYPPPVSGVGVSPSTSATALNFIAAAGSGVTAFELKQDAKFCFDSTANTKCFASNGTVLTLTGLNLSVPVVQATGDVSTASTSLVPKMGVLSGAPGLWLHNATPAFANFAVLSDGTGTLFNAPPSGYVELRVNNAMQVRVDTVNGLRQVARNMPTCSAANEWTMLPDALSGAATAKRSKLCLCTSNGSSTYAWQNIVTATVGTATTCGTE